MNVGSLFAGVGGFDLGFERAGFAPAYQVEIDGACNRVLAQHWPDVPRFIDVRDVGSHNLPHADVITFGSPCQDLSVAGKRAGLAGERSGLFHEAVRVIKECRPTIAVWENVPGAQSSTLGRDFGAALDALADAGALDIGWAVLDAQWFGVAQRRRRVFVVADFRGRRAGEILAIPYGMPGDTPPHRKAWQDLAGTLGGGTGSRGWAPDTERMTFVARTAQTGSNGWGVQEDVTLTLDGAQGQAVAFAQTVRRLTPTECERLQGFEDGWTAGQADGPRYKQLGNAVCVPVAEWLGRQIMAALRG